MLRRRLAQLVTTESIPRLIGEPLGPLGFSRTLATSALTSTPQVPSPLNFDNYQKVFEGQSSISLLRSVAVFRACSFPWFVKHAAPLLSLSRSVIGDGLTNKLVKHTFYAQFCAGENDEELQVKTKQLQSRGVGSILDYAAEDDVPTTNPTPTPAPPPEVAPPPTPVFTTDLQGLYGFPAGARAMGTQTSPPQHIGTTTNPAEPLGPGLPILPPGPAVARQYAYSTEAQCDSHVKIFLSCIDSASRTPGRVGFTAVKLTALGNPLLLERVSTAIREVRGLFKRWDTDGNGLIDKQEFRQAYHLLLPDATEEECERVFTWMDTQAAGKVDWVAWCQRLSLTKMPEYAARIKTPEGCAATEALRKAVLTPEEVQLVNAMRGRLSRLAKAAAQSGVKLLIDAEHSYFQPAIDHLTVELMRRYNTGPKGAVIYNTYQAYLVDSEPRLVVDLERARREKYTLGAKLVRGAYMEIERSRAADMGYPSPVWDTVQDTHDSYNRCVEVLLPKVKEGKAEVLLGTHNQGSIELAVAQMAALGLNPKTSHVYFGQLLGMSDHLTQVLGGAGYNAYKYVPYGRVEEVIPYLLRRASENASIMKGSKHDVALLQAELWRRACVALGMGQKRAVQASA